MKKLLSMICLCAVALSLTACAPKEEAPSDDVVDAVTTPSTYTNKYTNYSQEEVLQAMKQYRGLCTVATVNAEGTPNVAIFVPGVADDSHIMFYWANNATKENVLRDGKAVLTYDVANPTAESKEERHQGAVIKVELETDEQVLADLKANNEAVNDAAVVLKIVEVLPIG